MSTEPNGNLLPTTVNVNLYIYETPNGGAPIIVPNEIDLLELEISIGITQKSADILLASDDQDSVANGRSLASVVAIQQSNLEEHRELSATLLPLARHIALTLQKPSMQEYKTAKKSILEAQPDIQEEEFEYDMALALLPRAIGGDADATVAYDQVSMKVWEKLKNAILPGRVQALCALRLATRPSTAAATK